MNVGLFRGILNKCMRYRVHCSYCVNIRTKIHVKHMTKVEKPTEYYKEVSEETDTSPLTEHIRPDDAENLNVKYTDYIPDVTSPISDSTVHIENTSTAWGGENPIYYTSNLYEGVANVEEISDDHQQENECDKESNSEDEIYIATPIVSFETHLNQPYDSFDKELLVLQSLSAHDIAEQWTDKSVNYSDSNSDEGLYHLFSDLSSDEEQLSLVSPTLSEQTYSRSPGEGNLPFFDKLNVNVTTVTESNSSILSRAPALCRSIRMPVSTVASCSVYLESSSFKSRETSSRVILGTSHVGEVSINSIKKDIAKQTNEDNADKYCSTNVQSALLGKLNVDTRVDSGLSESSTVTAFEIDRTALPVIPRRNRSPSRRKTSSKYKEETNTIGKSDENSLETDLPIDLENVESEVCKAFKDSVSEGSMMPLVKQELQYTIQVRRLSRGKPELVLEPEQATKYELRPDEIKKKNVRLEQNRRSAHKSRIRIRSREKFLVKTVKNEMTEHVRLTHEVASLRKLKEMYEVLLEQHEQVCTRSITDNLH